MARPASRRTFASQACTVHSLPTLSPAFCITPVNCPFAPAACHEYPSPGSAAPRGPWTNSVPLHQAIDTLQDTTKLYHSSRPSLVTREIVTQTHFNITNTRLAMWSTHRHCMGESGSKAYWWCIRAAGLPYSCVRMFYVRCVVWQVKSCLSGKEGTSLYHHKSNWIVDKQNVTQ